jgi:protein-S-isoprenylcysteine O-methyltransferase Ste14
MLLFVPAGTLRWPGAWIFLAITVIGGLAVGFSLAHRDPALLAERLAPLFQRGQKPWDKILLTVIVMLFCAWLALMALDAARFQWSHVPVATQVLGALCVAVCLWITHLTFRANTFAAPVVKIQSNRAQRVVTSGPYRHVRHPMYAGALLYFLGAPLLLGSWYGLAAALAFVVILAIRIVLEERMLTTELRGYADYSARVRYRLIPFVW